MCLQIFGFNNLLQAVFIIIIIIIIISSTILNQVGNIPVSRHSTQLYTRTYYRLRKREPLIALVSHQRGGGGGLNLSPPSPPPGGGGGGGGGGGRFEHRLLAEVVPNGLVAFFDTRSESSGIFYYPHTGRGNADRDTDICFVSKCWMP